LGGKSGPLRQSKGPLQWATTEHSFRQQDFHGSSLGAAASEREERQSIVAPKQAARLVSFSAASKPDLERARAAQTVSTKLKISSEHSPTGAHLCRLGAPQRPDEDWLPESHFWPPETVLGGKLEGKAREQRQKEVWNGRVQTGGQLDARPAGEAPICLGPNLAAEQASRAAREQSERPRARGSVPSGERVGLQARLQSSGQESDWPSEANSGASFDGFQPEAEFEVQTEERKSVQVGGAKMAQLASRKQQVAAARQRQQSSESLYYKLDSSDTNSSFAAAHSQQACGRQPRVVGGELGGRRGKFYDENIILFATEHSQNNNNNNNNNNNCEHKQDSKQRRQAGRQEAAELQAAPVRASVRSVLRRGSKAHESPAGAGTAAGLGAGLGASAAVFPPERARSCAPMGRFVSAYPSSRQPVYEKGARSVAGPQPYAFHVPAGWQRASSPLLSSGSQLALGAPLSSLGGRQQGAATPHPPPRSSSSAAAKQLHYGYVAPSNKVDAKFNPSLRSKTIEHIPSMVQVSLQEATQSPAAPRWPAGDEPAPEVAAGKLAGERPLEQVVNAGDKHLLQVRPLGPNSLGHENPFKPGTELSWQADLMVRLIQRGYPIGELNLLVAAAKQLRDHRRRHHWQSCDRFAAGSGPVGAREPLEANGSQWAASKSRGAADCPSEERAQWAESPKRVWASSLARAKSLPRIVGGQPADSGRPLAGDSLDELITSIEREMARLLQASPLEQQASQPAELHTDTCSQTTGHLRGAGWPASASLSGSKSSPALANRRMLDRLMGRPAAEIAAPESAHSPAGRQSRSTGNADELDESLPAGREARLSDAKRGQRGASSGKSDSEKWALDEASSFGQVAKRSQRRRKRCCNIQ